MCIQAQTFQSVGPTRVGAILLFFGSLAVVSSFSLSLASRFVPAALLFELRGVSGGVVIGTPVTLPELAAVMLGTFPEIRGGLVKTPAVGATEAWVTIEEVELDRAGEEGRLLTNAA